MIQFIHDHQFGIINGAAWVIAHAAHYWLGITDKVAAASLVELVINGVMALTKGKKAINTLPPVPSTGLEGQEKKEN